MKGICRLNQKLGKGNVLHELVFFTRVSLRRFIVSQITASPLDRSSHAARFYTQGIVKPSQGEGFTGERVLQVGLTLVDRERLNAHLSEVVIALTAV